MSNQNVVLNTGNQLYVNSDLSKIFLGNQQTEADSYINNSSYNPITLFAGTVLGRIGSTGIVVPWTSGASDGSQKVLGILMADLTLASGAQATAPICVAGRVAAEKIICVTPGENLNTLVSNVRLKDKIQAEAVAIKLVYSTEMSGTDNF